MLLKTPVKCFRSKINTHIPHPVDVNDRQVHAFVCTRVHVRARDFRGGLNIAGAEARRVGALGAGGKWVGVYSFQWVLLTVRRDGDARG